MTRLLLLLLLFGAAPRLGAAQVATAVRHFDEGNQRFRQGDYRGALDAYQAAVDAGHVSGALYYNMGNAYYRLDALGQAIRHYEKARRLLPDSPELAHNLSIARARTVDRFSELPEPFWQAAWRGVQAAVGAWGLFAVGAALYLLAFALTGYRLWTGVRRPWQRRLRAVAFGGGLVLLLLAFAASLDRHLDARAVVLDAVVSLYEAPATDAAPLLDVHEGLTVGVLTRQGGWAEVRLPNGATGWLDATTLAEI